MVERQLKRLHGSVDVSCRFRRLILGRKLSYWFRKVLLMAFEECLNRSHDVGLKVRVTIRRDGLALS